MPKLILAPIFLSIYLVSGCSPSDSPAENAAAGKPDDRPNILLIVVDDMGYNDLGSFGGEIETPNLDRLANAGIRFTNFQAASTCSPTRSMLMTGVDTHRAGLGNMLEELSPNQKGQPGYEGVLNDRVVTVATMLRDAGYQTLMSGKWHLGKGDEHAPTERGFQRAFSMHGGASHFDDMRPTYAPNPDAKATYRDEGVMLESLPDTFEYSTQFYVDRLIEYLSDAAYDDAPIFAYLPFTAPHWPLQAPDSAVEKYRGRYDGGYDALLTKRLKKAQAIGVIPQAARVGPPPPKYVPWNELTATQRNTESRAMEIYAAMVDEVDRHSGRLISHLKALGEFENTVIIFMSDNGAEGHDLDETWPAEAFPKIRKAIDSRHDFSYEAMGKPGSYVLYGANWARAASPAFNLYKAFPTEGGTRVAAFAYYAGFKQNAIIDDLISVKDITPTLLDIAGVKPHDGTYDGRAVEPISGISQLAALTGEGEQADPNRVLAFELFGKRSVRRGDWKIVHMPAPYGTDEWQLYNLSNDIAEANDLSVEHADIKQELIAEWDKFAKENNVILPDWVSGY